VREARAQLAAPRLAAERHLVERHVAECALADGWGDPVRWLTDAALYFRNAGHLHVERACRSLLRRAGAPVPHHPRSSDIPRAWTALGVTDREADVLVLVAEGLTSREIADRLFISVRTVDKHVEHLLEKTRSTRRTELRAFRT
jgi:DNA-binding CsgD family transcriptional regulator